MALTNYERQKRWREKNRVIYNLRRRNARKSEKVETPFTHGTGAAPVSTIDKLRELVRVEQEKPRTEAPATPVKPLVYRNDYGNVITEGQWNQLQEKKMLAKEKGYVIDEYSQT